MQFCLSTCNILRMSHVSHGLHLNMNGCIAKHPKQTTQCHLCIDVHILQGTIILLTTISGHLNSVASDVSLVVSTITLFTVERQCDSILGRVYAKLWLFRSYKYRDVDLF